jgi:hypothetical protein
MWPQRSWPPHRIYRRRRPLRCRLLVEPLAYGTDFLGAAGHPSPPNESPALGHVTLDREVHSHVFMTVDRAVELIGAFLQGNGEVAGASECDGGGGLVLYARAVDGEVVGEFALVGNLEGVCPSGEGLDGNVILDSDSVTVIDVPGAAAAVAAEVDGRVVAGLLLPLLQLARVTAAAMRITPR